MKSNWNSISWGSSKIKMKKISFSVDNVYLYPYNDICC